MLILSFVDKLFLIMYLLNLQHYYYYYYLFLVYTQKHTHSLVKYSTRSMFSYLKQQHTHLYIHLYIVYITSFIFKEFVFIFLMYSEQNKMK